ncbi:Uncharacterized protein Adt_33474 [Abeliophyllum distichum]|uniref:Reverse transcriptase domain-containing protein n=1 Tax=Abeliophyllum distichum TaxID=126358 RepID=A0ABD1QWH1_9LAMI
MFTDQLRSTMEVFIDDILVKSLRVEDHVQYLEKTFQDLSTYMMKLNPLKCVFGVTFGKFLGYMVNRKRIKANPEKIKALIEMKSTRRPKDVQYLTGRMAALIMFVSKATYKCLPFFKILKGQNMFEWMTECEVAFQLGLNPRRRTPAAYLLRKQGPPGSRDTLPRYGEDGIITHHRLQEIKAILLAHNIHVFTNFFLRAAIKEKALVDFVAEFTSIPEIDASMTPI